MCARSLTLRALVNARLTAAAEEIFALVERTIAEYEEELCRSKEENQRNQQLLDSVLKTQLLHTTEGVQTDFSPKSRVIEGAPDAPQIKAEPEELKLQDEEQLPECTAVCVKSEESEDQTDNSSDNEEEPPASSSTAQMETEAHNSGLFSKYKCGAESRATVTEGHGEKRYECAFCHKRYTTKRVLKIHIRTHTGEKPYSCSFCEKTFSQQTSLDFHVRVHTGERPYSCSVCKKTFSQKGNLNTHMKIHTGEKPYSCSGCDKSFSLRHHLKEHMITHTKEKPFSCSICSKTFTQKTSLNVHTRRQHKDTPERSNATETEEEPSARSYKPLKLPN